MTLKRSPQPSPLTSMPHAAARQIRNAPSPAPPVEILQSNPGCVSLSSALNICESATPSFTNLSPTQQAPCLCYSQTSWHPTNFDHAVASCAQFASTALPDAYSALANLEGFCASVGNVQMAASSIITSIPSDTSCSSAFSILQRCNNLTPGFLALGPTQQASCLCYASVTSWAPKTFDEAISKCSDYARTAASGLMVSVSWFDGLCASVGDVRSVSGLGLGSLSVSGGVQTLTLGSGATTEMTLRPSATLSPSPASVPTMDRSIPTTDRSIPTTMTTSSNPQPAISTPSTTTRITPTTSAAVIGGNQDGDISLTQVSDPMIIAVSFACAALVLFLC
ncbi:hypothetical protein CJF31_00001466 [Rutstroemia sp. NJR-2017a BVV2]|nr:hypothetical protein CJF31_00001466 [Rutstroemia sp. NJR-2017a BVV2]